MMLAQYAIPKIKLSLHFVTINIVFILYIVTHSNNIADAASRQIDIDARTIFYINQPPNAKGDFKFEFQTTNGITTKAAGNEHGFSGVVQYVSNEGIPVTMTYTADADGYHPTGDYIHPTPEHVIRSLEYIRTHPIDVEKISRNS